MQTSGGEFTGLYARIDGLTQSPEFNGKMGVITGPSIIREGVCRYPVKTKSTAGIEIKKVKVENFTILDPAQMTIQDIREINELSPLPSREPYVPIKIANGPDAQPNSWTQGLLTLETKSDYSKQYELQGIDSYKTLELIIKEIRAKTGLSQGLVRPHTTSEGVIDIMDIPGQGFPFEKNFLNPAATKYLEEPKPQYSSASTGRRSHPSQQQQQQQQQPKPEIRENQAVKINLNEKFDRLCKKQAENDFKVAGINTSPESIKYQFLALYLMVDPGLRQNFLDLLKRSLDDPYCTPEGIKAMLNDEIEIVANSSPASDCSFNVTLPQGIDKELLLNEVIKNHDERAAGWLRRFLKEGTSQSLSLVSTEEDSKTFKEQLNGELIGDKLMMCHTETVYKDRHHETLFHAITDVIKGNPTKITLKTAIPTVGNSVESTKFCREWKDTTLPLGIFGLFKGRLIQVLSDYKQIEREIKGHVKFDSKGAKYEATQTTTLSKGSFNWPLCTVKIICHDGFTVGNQDGAMFNLAGAGDFGVSSSIPCEDGTNMLLYPSPQSKVQVSEYGVMRLETTLAQLLQLNKVQLSEESEGPTWTAIFQDSEKNYKTHLEQANVDDLKGLAQALYNNAEPPGFIDLFKAAEESPKLPDAIRTLITTTVDGGDKQKSRVKAQLKAADEYCAVKKKAEGFLWPYQPSTNKLIILLDPSLSSDSIERLKTQEIGFFSSHMKSVLTGEVHPFADPLLPDNLFAQETCVSTDLGQRRTKPERFEQRHQSIASDLNNEFEQLFKALADKDFKKTGINTSPQSIKHHFLALYMMVDPIKKGAFLLKLQHKLNNADTSAIENMLNYHIKQVTDSSLASDCSFEIRLPAGCTQAELLAQVTTNHSKDAADWLKPFLKETNDQALYLVSKEEASKSFKNKLTEAIGLNDEVMMSYKWIHRTTDGNLLAKVKEIIESKLSSPGPNCCDMEILFPTVDNSVEKTQFCCKYKKTKLDLDIFELFAGGEVLFAPLEKFTQIERKIEGEGSLTASGVDYSVTQTTQLDRSSGPIADKLTVRFICDQGFTLGTPQGAQLNFGGAGNFADVYASIPCKDNTVMLVYPAPDSNVQILLNGDLKHTATLAELLNLNSQELAQPGPSWAKIFNDSKPTVNDSKPTVSRCTIC